jgi:hypothetical protein
MTIQEAYDKLPEYLEGGLTPDERGIFEVLLKRDSGLAAAAKLSNDLEGLLKTQEWVEPSAGFTWIVLGRAGLVHLKRAPLFGTVWDRVKAGVSLANLVVLLSVFWNSIASIGMKLIEHIGLWLDGALGLRVFATHPMVMIGVFAPIVVGGITTCLVTGRCRFIKVTA